MLNIRERAARTRRIRHGRGTGLVSAILLAASMAASAAQGDTAILAYVGNSSFWIDIPDDWTSSPEQANERNALFILAPADNTAADADPRIVGSSHRNASVMETLNKLRADILSQDPTADIKAPSTLGIGRIQASLVETRSSPDRARLFETIALIPLRTDVVVVRLSAASEDSYRRGHDTLMKLLESFADSSAGSR